MKDMTSRCVTIVVLGALMWGCGGSSSTSGAGACTEATPCGGALDGTTWQLDSVCTIGGVAAALNQAEFPWTAACSGAVTSASLSATGTVSFANGTQTNNVTTITQGTMVLTPACAGAMGGVTITTLDASTCTLIGQEISSTAGDTGTCTLAGSNCSCSVTITGTDTTSTSYTISGTSVTYANGDNPTDYCVSGSSLSASQALAELPGVTLVSKLHKI